MNQQIEILKAYDVGDHRGVDSQVVHRCIDAGQVAEAIELLVSSANGGCKNSLEALAAIYGCHSSEVLGEDNLPEQYRHEQFSDIYESLGYGCIYVLINEHMPGLFKVGYTTQSVKERIKQVSGTTGVPTPFVELFSIATLNCRDAEALAHRKLSKYRINEGREFFKCDADVMVKACVSSVLETHIKLGLSEDGDVLKGVDYFPDIAYAEDIAKAHMDNPSFLFRRKPFDGGPF